MQSTYLYTLADSSFSTDLIYSPIECTLTFYSTYSFSELSLPTNLPTSLSTGPDSSDPCHLIKYSITLACSTFISPSYLLASPSLSIYPSFSSTPLLPLSNPPSSLIYLPILNPVFPRPSPCFFSFFVFFLLILLLVSSHSSSCFFSSAFCLFSFLLRSGGGCELYPCRLDGTRHRPQDPSRHPSRTG